MAVQKFKMDGNPRIRTWTVRGINEDDGGEEVATIVLELNAAWQGPNDESEYCYHTYYYLDDMSEDQHYFGSYDDRQSAEARAEWIARTLEEAYVERGLRLRQERALDLRDMVSDWAIGPDRMLIEMVADLIESGQAGDLLNEAINEVIESRGGDHVAAN